MSIISHFQHGSKEAFSIDPSSWSPPNTNILLELQDILCMIRGLFMEGRARIVWAFRFTQ